MKTIFSLTIFFTVILFNASAQWQQTNGPYGGTISCMATNGANIYAGTPHGMLISTDTGRHWISSDNGLTNPKIKALAVSGTSVYAGTEGGVFLSTDNCGTWNNIGLTNSTINSLAISGANIYAGVDTGVFLSDDAGVHWTPMNKGLKGLYPFPYGILSLAAIGSDLIAGTFQGGLFFSSDSAKNWSASTVPFGIPYSFSINSFAVTGTHIFAATSHGVFMSADTGKNWLGVNTGLTNTYTYPFGVSLNSIVVLGNKIFVAGNGNGIFLSTDSGVNWSNINAGSSLIYITSLAITGNKLFAGTDRDGIFASLDNGSNWELVGGRFTNILSLRTHGNSIFVGIRHASIDGTISFPGGVFLSNDDGLTWKPTSLRNSDVWSLFSSETKIFAGTSDGIYASSDSGKIWFLLPFPSFTFGLSFTEKGDTIFAGTTRGVFRSSDNGDSWTEVNSGLINTSQYPYTDPHRIAALATFGNNILAGAQNGGGIFRSSNNGATWTDAGLPGLDVSAITINGNKIIAGTWGSGVFISTDTAKSWARDTTGMGNANNYTFAVTVDRVFAGNVNSNLSFVPDGGVFLSSNTSGPWVEVNDGLSDVSITALTFSNSNIYAGTGSSGVWKRPLGDFAGISTGISGVTHKNPDFIIYPNPTQNNFTVTTVDELEDAHLQIFNVLGENVHSDLFIGKQKTVTTKLAPGIYFVKVTDGQKQFNQKLIIQ